MLVFLDFPVCITYASDDADNAFLKICLALFWPFYGHILHAFTAHLLQLTAVFSRVCYARKLIT